MSLLSLFQQCYHAKRSVIMVNAVLSIAGGSHQGHERFNEISRGRQCSFMSFQRCCEHSRAFPMQLWDTATVEQTLIEGDRMYLNALERQRISDRDPLSPIYLPNQARSTVQSPAIEVTEQNISPVEVTKSPSEANNSRQSPVEAKTILNKSPITVTNADLPIADFCYIVIT